MNLPSGEEELPPVTVLAHGTHPATDLRRSWREETGPMEAWARWPLPCPPWPWDSPGLRGRSIGWLVIVSDKEAVPSCAFVVAQRHRLAPSSSASSSLNPTVGFRPRSDHVLLPRGCPRGRSFGPSHDVSFAFPKNAPSPCSDRGVHSRFHVAVVASEIGSQPVSRSAFVVSHHPDGLLLLDLLRIFVGVPVLGFVTFHAALYRNPRHVVLPFEAFIPVCSGPCRLANHASVGSHVTRRVSPPVHREPCPLVLVPPS